MASLFHAFHQMQLSEVEKWSLSQLSYRWRQGGCKIPDGDRWCLFSREKSVLWKDSWNNMTDWLIIMLLWQFLTWNSGTSHQTACHGVKNVWSLSWLVEKPQPCICRQEKSNISLHILDVTMRSNKKILQLIKLSQISRALSILIKTSSSWL